MREIIKYAFILGLICFLASSVLALVNGVTEPKIKLQKEDKENAGLKEVMPEASTFRPKVKDGAVIYYLALGRDDRIKGFVLKTQVKGYSSEIEALTGLDLGLKITQVKILNQNETPGLGNKINEAYFLGQFKGKNLSSFKEVQAITGATISSSAVINSIRNRISELNEEFSKEVAYAR